MKLTFDHNKQGAIYLLPALAFIINRTNWVTNMFQDGKWVEYNPIRDIALHFMFIRWHFWVTLAADPGCGLAINWDRIWSDVDYKFLRPIRGIWYNKIMPMVYKLRYKPIYFSYFSRDCDMYETHYLDIFRQGKKTFQKWCESKYEDAEGPVGIHICTKADYDEWYEETNGCAGHRDRVM